MPSKRRLSVVVCLALVTLAGCLGGTSPNAGTPTSTNSGGDGRPSTIPDDATVVNYTALSATQQHAFDAALAADEIRLIDGRAWDAPDSAYNYDAVVRSWPGSIEETYVRRNTSYYTVTVDGPSCCAGGGDRLSLTQIESPGNQTVTHLANHSGREWDYVKYVIEHDSTLPGWNVQAPVRDGVIEYHGDYYEVDDVEHADFGRASMSVTKVEQS